MQEPTMEEVLEKAKESLNQLKKESNDALSGSSNWDPNDLLDAQQEVLKSFDQVQSALEKAKGKE